MDSKPISDSRFWSRDMERWLAPSGKPPPSAIARSIQKSLQLLHSCGIEYGSALDMDSIWLQECAGLGDPRVFFTNFSLAAVGNRNMKKFRWKQDRELKWWRAEAETLSRHADEYQSIEGFKDRSEEGAGRES